MKVQNKKCSFPGTTPAAAEQGFSLVETIVAAVLLAIAATSAFTLFTASQTLFFQGRDKDNDQVAISQDLARIERLNRRFVCSQGSCDFIDTLSPGRINDPTEMEYTPPYPVGTYPPGADFNDKMKTFRDDICAVIPSEPSELVGEFKIKADAALASDPSAALPAGIERNISINPAAQETPPTPHAYVVIYTRNNQVLRRARLVPTVAGWCP